MDIIMYVKCAEVSSTVSACIHVRFAKFFSIVLSSSDSDADDRDVLERHTKFVVPVHQFSTDLSVKYTDPFVLLWVSHSSSPSSLSKSALLRAAERSGGRCSTVCEVKTDSEEYQLFVVTHSPAEKYLFLDFLGKIYCLCVQSEHKKELLTFLTDWLSSFKLSLGSTLQHFSSGEPISISDLCELPNLSTVHVAHTTPVTWVFDFQCTPMVKHNITLTRLRKDSLADIKNSFLRALKQDNEIQSGGSLCEVWLIHNNAVLTEDLLQKMLGWSFAWPPLKDIDFPFKGDGCIPLRHEASRKSDTFEVQVYLQPVDAIPKCLFLKKPLQERLKRDKMTIVLPRDVTHEQMRLQIATALGQKQGALRITLGRQPLDKVGDLQKHLHSRTSHLWVTIQSPIALKFYIEDHSRGVMTGNTLHFYSSDTIQDMKSEVSGLLNVPSYQIDLTYEGQSLPEKESIQSCGIETGVEINASVSEKRVILKLLFLGDKKSAVNVLINDIEKTTIRALKRFSKIAMPAFTSLLNSEILAILQNKVHSDSETLSEAGVCRESPPQQLVLKANKTLCFSAASVTRMRTFITCQDNGKGGFKELYTMASGAHIFTANIETNQMSRSKLLSLRGAVQPPQRIRGIKVWPDNPSTEMRCPHSSSTATRPSEVTVQNQRLNGGTCTGSCTVSCQTSQQDIAASAGRSTATQESHGRADGSASHDTCTGGMAAPRGLDVPSASHDTCTGGMAAPRGLDVPSASHYTCTGGMTTPRGLDVPSTNHDTCTGRMAAPRDLDVPGTAQRKEGSQKQNNLEDRGGTISPLEGMSSNSTTVQDPENNETDCIQARGSEGHTLQTAQHCPESISSPQAVNSGPGTRQAAEVLQEPRPSTSRKRSVDEVTDECDSTERILAKRKKSTGQSAETKKQQTLKRTVIEYSREESEIQGRVELKRTESTSLFVNSTDATDAQMAMIQCGTRATDLAEMHNEAHMLTSQLSLSHEEQAMWHDAKFKYIDKRIILAVAKELGRDGTHVITQLEVPYPKLQELEARYGICSASCHLECLIEWCKMSGKKANPDTLKKVLADNSRNDLVEVVDGILSGKTGYQTC